MNRFYDMFHYLYVSLLKWLMTRGYMTQGWHLYRDELKQWLGFGADSKELAVFMLAGVLRHVVLPCLRPDVVQWIEPADFCVDELDKTFAHLVYPDADLVQEWMDFDFGMGAWDEARAVFLSAHLQQGTISMRDFCAINYP